MTMKILFEVFCFMLLYSFIVLSAVGIELAVLITYAINLWFKEREDYVKRMSLIPDHVHDYEQENVN